MARVRGDDMAIDMIIRVVARLQLISLMLLSYRRNRPSSNEVPHQLTGESLADRGRKFKCFGTLFAKEALWCALHCALKMDSTWEPSRYASVSTQGFREESELANFKQILLIS